MPREILKNYGKWSANPRAPDIPVLKGEDYPEMIAMKTMYEDTLTYLRYWNFWVRVGTAATDPSVFFRNFESGAADVWNLINAVGAPTAWPQNEQEIWSRISTVWSWLADNVTFDSNAYSSIVTSNGGGWPSIDAYAQYYVQHNSLVWSACFSKAHLFATLLGRVLPRWHVIIAEGHHTEGGAPPTASHVYVGVYLTGRWYYLDPTAVATIVSLPAFKDRKSVGIFKLVDYEHPWEAIPVPLSPLDGVPYLGP